MRTPEILVRTTNTSTKNFQFPTYSRSLDRAMFLLMKNYLRLNSQCAAKLENYELIKIYLF